MALITCPDCGKEHSDQAVACPQCGRPNQPLTPKTESATTSGEGSAKPQGCFIGCLGLFVLVIFLGILSSLSPDANKPDAWDEIAAKVYCEDRIKQLLRDPDSYQFSSAEILETSGENSEFGKARISFRAKNGFGGYNANTATCEAYPNNGERWIKAQLD